MHLFGCDLWHGVEYWDETVGDPLEVVDVAQELHAHLLQLRGL